jgi:raffinose/stachyose/melibiose transport system permease protein
VVLLLITPFVVYTVFFIYPVINTVFLSFFNWGGIAQVPPKFIGFKNYSTLLKQNVFWQSLWNSCVFIIVSLGVIMPVSFLLAMLVSDRRKGTGVLRTIYYIPTLLPMTATGLMWSFMLFQDGGAINALLKIVGIAEGPDWLGDQKISIWSVAFVNAWMFLGSNMLVFLTGLTSIPHDMIEASIIDGASGLKKIWFIIIPNLKESFKLFLVSAIAGSIKVFDIIYVMTGGGPGNATDVPATLLFSQAFLYSKFGYGASIGVFILLSSLLITFILNNAFNEKNEETGGRRRWKLN